jgi:hypothetical protein
MDRYERDEARKREIEALAEEVDPDNILEGHDAEFRLKLCCQQSNSYYKYMLLIPNLTLVSES